MQARLAGSLAVLLVGSAIVVAKGADIKVVPDVVRPVVEDKQRPLEPNQVKLTGLLGERIMAAEKNRLLTIDEDLLLDGFRKRPGEHPWIGEHVGKWLHAATLVWVYSGDEKLREKLDRVVAGLLPAQLPDGYLGTYLDKDRWTSWDVWSHKYDLIGLLTYYRYTGHQPSLEACKRIGDLLCNTFGQDKRDIIKAGEHVGMAATSVLEPMVLLYRATGDKKYLEFCRYILWSWDQPHGPKILSTLRAGKGVNEVANGKAYEMLSNLVGLCELYRTTGEVDLLPPVIHAWEDIVAKRLYISGSASQGELFRDDHFLPNDEKPHIMETCVTVTWIQLNAQLLRLTSDPRYADQLERTVYNQLLFAQKPDGSDFCYYNPLEGKRTWKPLGQRDIHCCLSSGPRGLALIPTFAYGVDDRGVVVNLYESGEAQATLKDGRIVSLKQITDFPLHGTARVHPQCNRTGVYMVRLRLPATGWLNTASIASDDLGPGKVEAKKLLDYSLYVTVPQERAEGSPISMEMQMAIGFQKGQGSNQGKLAVMRGPLVLAAEEQFNPEAKPLAGIGISPLEFGVSASSAEIPGSKGKPVPLYRVQACVGKERRIAAEIKMMPLAWAGSSGTWHQVWFPRAEPGCEK